MYFKSRTYKTGMFGLILLASALSLQAQNSLNGGQPSSVTILDTTREQDGLAGSVRRVKVESAKLELKSGHLVEGPRQLQEVTTYSLGGQRVENVSYPVGNAPVGKEEYKYDNKGNIVEMTLRGADSSIVSREAYDYEFDKLGNWKKMVTSLVLFEGGELKREPVEVTYRTLTYYFDDAVASLIQSRPRSTAVAVPAALERGVLDSDIQIARGPNFVAASSVSVSVAGEPPPIPPAVKKEPEVIRSINKESNSPSRPIQPQRSAVSENVAFVTSHKVERHDVAVPSVPATNNSATTTTAKTTPNAFDLYRTGQEHLAAGDWKEALRDFQQSLILEPGSAQANLSIGFVYHKMNKPGDAARSFKQAVLLNPDLSEAHYGLGLSYFGMRRYQDAANAFKRTVALRPDSAKAHYGLALAYQEMGKTEDLIAEYRTLQTLDKALAKQLAATFPEFDLPCRTAPFCK